jgi:hypothetical protein
MFPRTLESAGNLGVYLRRVRLLLTASATAATSQVYTSHHFGPPFQPSFARCLFRVQLRGAFRGSISQL